MDSSGFFKSGVTSNSNNPRQQPATIPLSGLKIMIMLSVKYWNFLQFSFLSHLTMISFVGFEKPLHFQKTKI
jgi:hypothetical protein